MLLDYKLRGHRFFRGRYGLGPAQIEPYFDGWGDFRFLGPFVRQIADRARPSGIGPYGYAKGRDADVWPVA